jgi:rod shape-determining protein MreB
MKHGVIADYLITEAMLRHFIGKVVGRFNLIRPEVMICIPAGVTSVEQRAVRDAAEQAGARRPAHLIPEPLARQLGRTSRWDSAAHDPGHRRGRRGGCYLDVRHRGGRVGPRRRRPHGRPDVSRKRRHNHFERTAEDAKSASAARSLDEELTMQVPARPGDGLPRPSRQQQRDRGAPGRLARRLDRT